MAMRDLVELVYQAKELSETEQVEAIAKAIFEELQQTDFKRFTEYFSSAAIDRKSMEYVIVLKFKM